MKTFFTSLNAAGASGPSSRPRPDCLNPPNGVQYRTDECELTERFPASTPRATRSARPTSAVKIAPDSPTSLSLASEAGSTTVGGNQKPPLRSSAPGTAPAKATSVPSTYDETEASCPAVING